MVIPIGNQLSFSRQTNQSIDAIKNGVMLRGEPLIITDDCVSLNITNNKRSHIKQLGASLRGGHANYLSAIMPGDWVLAWCWDNIEDQSRVLSDAARGKKSNNANDGLKFVGRVNSIRKRIHVDNSGNRESSYFVDCAAFTELNTQLYYDLALASAHLQNSVTQFMAEIGQDFSKWTSIEQQKAGNIKDNAGYVIESLIEMIIGKGLADAVNLPMRRGNVPDAVPQANKEAPYAYLIPGVVASLLGRPGDSPAKASCILDTIIGVQDYSNDAPYPVLKTKGSRKQTPEPVKGTYLPVSHSFINAPLFSVLQRFLNPTLNEMFTSLRCDENGDIIPTLINRQIPFSTDVVNTDLPITRFSSLPRWVLSPLYVHGMDVGRSDATRVNIVHVYGDASAYKDNKTVTHQLVRNPPIMDALDIQRSGPRVYSRVVECAGPDQTRQDGARLWMEAIADWTIGSHLTLNGSIYSMGIQLPIAEGDNLEFEGVIYHIEGITHNCSIDASGRKSFRTSFELSNGMPVEQKDASSFAPSYPGIKNNKEFDSLALTTQDPGETVDSSDVIQTDAHHAAHHHEHK